MLDAAGPALLCLSCLGAMMVLLHTEKIKRAKKDKQAGGRIKRIKKYEEAMG